MTTVLASFHLGVMVSDTGVTAGDRVWTGQRKVWRVKGALLGFSGDVLQGEAFIDWWRGGRKGDGPDISKSEVLVLDCFGLSHFIGKLNPTHVARGLEAIGSGAVAALSAFEGLGFRDPRKAVQIACKHDAGSRKPVRIYTL